MGKKSENISIIDKGLTIMSSYDSNLSVIEAQSGVMTIVDVNGSSGLGGQSAGTQVSASAAQ